MNSILKPYFYYLYCVIASLLPSFALAEGEEIPVATCLPDQTPAQYSLTAMETLPPVEAISFPSPFTKVVAPDVRRHNVRLDLCINMDSSVELKQFVTMILARGGAIPHVRVLTKEDNVEVSTLIEFIFGDNVKDLKLSLPGMEYIHHFELKGWEYQGQTFVTWTEFVDQNGTLINQPNITVGQLALGDFSRSNELCQPFEGFAKGRYPVRDFLVEVDYCTFRGGGETTGMRLVGLVLSGPSISETIQLKENELAANQVFFTYHHHNSCDALSINLPSIKLGLRSAATFTMQDEHCTKPFYLAPGRDPLRAGEPGIIYELEIPGASKVEGHIAECSHVLSCGNK